MILRLLPQAMTALDIIVLRRDFALEVGRALLDITRRVCVDILNCFVQVSGACLLSIK